MSFSFSPHQGLIIVTVEVAGSLGNAVLRMALDTVATLTLINSAPLVAIGYNPTQSIDLVQVTTGSGVELVPRITASKVTALGMDQIDFLVLCHTLPPSADIDGLLGLDFFPPTLDARFSTGQIDLT